MLNRKGVSPLIATVLLIAFAVALGALVMSWGKEFVQDTAADQEARIEESRTCNLDVRLQLKQGSKGSKICYDKDDLTLNFIADNIGMKQIDELRVDVVGTNIGENSVAHLVYIRAIPVGGLFKSDGTAFADVFVEDGDNLEFVKITPVVIRGNSPIVCAESAVEVTSVSKC